MSKYNKNRVIMSEREFVRGSSEREQSEELAPLPTASTSAMDVSDLLDAIDLVLEENAEEFVKGFVQKGGQ